MTQLRTQRLVLEPIGEPDLPQLHEIWTSAGVRRFLFDDEVLPLKRSCELVRESERLQRTEQCGMWAVRMAGSPDIVGFIGYWYFRDPPERELLYGVAPEYWGQGFATESAREMLNYGFRTLRLNEVIASTDLANVASVRVLEKIGLQFDRRAVVKGLDTVFYKLSEAVWRRHYLD